LLQLDRAHICASPQKNLPSHLLFSAVHFPTVPFSIFGG
jgi:hypothetical protein